MRRFLPWFLMLLLALRGLTGTAVAAEFVPERPAQTAPATAAASNTTHGMDADQSMAAGATAAPACHSAAGDGCAPHAHSPSCSACDICHSALLAPPTLAAPPVHAGSEVQPSATTPFASAQAALAIKPPIL